MRQPTRIQRALLATTLVASTLAPQSAYAFDLKDLLPWNWGKSTPAATQQAKPQSTSASSVASRPKAAKPATLESKVNTQPCADGSKQPCVVRTYDINSPTPGVNETYVTKHDATGKEIDRVVLKHTYTPVKNNAIPHADRFVHNPNLGTYVAVLCKGESLQVHTPKGPGNEAYIIDKPTRNTADEVDIGKDFIITYDEIKQHKLDAVDLLYDVILKKGDKNCSSYKAEVIAFAKDNCATSATTSVPAPKRPKGTAPANPAPNPTPDAGTPYIKLPETVPGGKTPPADNGSDKKEVGNKRLPAGKSYWELTTLVGTGTDQYTGTQQVHPATGGVVTKETDPAQYDITQFKIQAQHFGPRHNFFINYAGTVGNDAGSPTGNYDAFMSQSIGASSFGIGTDLTTGPLVGPVGVGVGGRFESKTVTTYDNIFGETSKQSNQEYGGRAFLSIGSMDESFGLIGAEYWVQPINEKYQTGDGKPYTARSSTEGMLTGFAKTRLKFGANDQGVLDADFRYAPKVTTIYASDAQELTSTSKFLNTTLGVGWNFTENVGIYGQARFAHNEETVTRPDPKFPNDRSKDLTDSYKHDSQTISGGLRFTW